MLAVHGFFYAVDCARALLAGTGAGDALQAAWPSPTLAQVEAAAGELCSMDWGEVQEAQRQRKHRYTAGLRQLEGRCHMLNAVLVLLRDALLVLPSAAAGEDGGGAEVCASGMGNAGGAAAAPGGAEPAVSLAITFAEELGGESVDWPLGAYLSLVVARGQRVAGAPASAVAASAASAAVARSSGASGRGGGGGGSGGGGGGMVDVEGAELFALLTLVAFATMLFAVQRLSSRIAKRPRSPPVRAYYELQTEYLR